MWIIVQGDEIVFGCDRAGQKAINLRRNPSIVLSVEDEVRNAHGFQCHLVIRRRAVIEDRSDPVLMDRLARKDAGLDRHPLAVRDSPSAVVIRVSIDRISGVGPWVD